MRQTKKAKEATQQALEALNVAWAGGARGWKYMFVWQDSGVWFSSYSKHYCFGESYEPQYGNGEYQFSRKWLKDQKKK